MTDSWRLKVERAKHHMIEIERAAIAYAGSHPYEFVRVRLPDSERTVKSRLRMTAQPDPNIALMLGDFVHNLRSALDHIMGGLVPKSRRGSVEFPISLFDFRAKDANGEFMIKDDDGRRKFESSIKGVDTRAEARIISMQPYHLRDQAYLHKFSLVSRLDNLDKHREIIIFGYGVRNLVVTRSVGNRTVTHPHPIGPTKFIQDGQAVWFILAEDAPSPSKMDVQYSATAEIFVQLPSIGGGKRNAAPKYFPLSDILPIVSGIAEALDILEPFVIR